MLSFSAHQRYFLFTLERKYRENGLSPEEKLARRQEDIKPGFYAFNEWVETQHKNIWTKGAIVRALHYAVNQLPMIEPSLKLAESIWIIMPLRTSYDLWCKI
jgi:hypothetical protein